MAEQKAKRARARKVDPMVFAKAYVESDENATLAFEKTRGKRGDLSPNYMKVGGAQMMQKPEVRAAIEIVKEELNNHAFSAVKKVGELINSENEVVAGQNARFVIEHIKGKPVTQAVNTNLNIYEAVDSLVLDVDAPEADVIDETA